jgi:large conductance mechanosensitive channel
MSGFRKFLLRGNVVDLAIAVVIGAAFVDIVKAIVKGLITPLIGALGGVPDLSAWVVTVRSSNFLVGEIINAIIGFLVVAAIVYFVVVLPMAKLMDRFAPGDPGMPKRDCPECLSKIPEAARRCMFCTAEVQPVQRAAQAPPL